MKRKKPKGLLVTPAISSSDSELTYHGDFIISSEEELAEAQRYIYIVGSIVIGGTQLKKVYFPNIKALYGNITVRNNRVIKSLSFPVLEIVTGSIEIINCRNLEHVELPSLAVIGLYIDTSFFPAFLTVNNREDWILSLSGIKKLEVLRLPSLVVVAREVFLSLSPSFLELHFPRLHYVGLHLEITGGNTSTQLSIPHLSKIREQGCCVTMDPSEVCHER